MNTASWAPTNHTRYTAVAMVFHALMALLIVGNLALGLYMSDLPLSMTRLKLYNWHKWAGAVVLALAALRLLWRLTHRPPPALPGPQWQQRAAHAAHVALYALFFAVPLSGWAYSSSAGFPLVVFGVLPLPDWVPVNRALSEVLEDLHETLAQGFGLLMLLHVAAALKHQWLDKQRLLQRIFPLR